MSEKQSPKVNLGARSINFFLIGCIIGLTISLLALDIWANIKPKFVPSISVEEAAKNEENIISTDDQQKQEEEQPEEEEKPEEIEQILKETEKEVEMVFDFSSETTDDESIEFDPEDDEISTDTENGDIEEPIIKMPQVRAEFPGGNAELRKYLAENCEYPKAAREALWQGVVIVEFVVEKDGRIGQVNVIKSVCSSLDEEAIRVVKGMPKWKAGENNGQKCRSFFQLPITFSLQ